MTALRAACIRFAVLVAGASTFSASPAQAQAQGDADAARELASRGLAAYRAGRWQEAIELLEQAEARFHAPTHAYYAGASREALGDTMGAFDTYSALVAEELPNYAPDAFRKARDAAADGMRRLQRQVASLDVRISTPLPEGAAIELDGVRLDASRLARPIAVAPGPHRVGLRIGEIVTLSRAVDAIVGRSEIVSLDTASTATNARTSGSAASRAGALPPNGFGFAPAIVTFSLSGAALVAGAVTGGLTLARTREIERHCDDNGVCPAEYGDDADEARTLGVASTALFGVAGAGVVAGIVLAVVGRPTRAEGSDVTLDVGPGSLAVRGRF